MKLLVYRDNKGFVFGPADNKEEIEKAVKLVKGPIFILETIKEKIKQVNK